MEPELLQPPSPGNFCLFFVDLFAGRGGSTAAAVTLYTVADESRKKMAEGVVRSPSRLCSRDGKICCCGDALSTIFLLAFVPCFLLFVFLFFPFLLFLLHTGMFIFFVSLRLCSSHLLLSASTYFIVRVISACVFCTLPNLGILSFFIRLFLPYPISEFFRFLFVYFLFIYFS